MDNTLHEKGPPMRLPGKVVRKIFHEQAFKQHGIHSPVINPNASKPRNILEGIANFFGAKDNQLRAASGENFSARTSTFEAVSPWSRDRDRKFDELAARVDTSPQSIEPSDLADIFVIQVNALEYQIGQQQKELGKIDPYYSKERKRIQKTIGSITTDRQFLMNLLSVLERRATGQPTGKDEASILFNHLRTQVISWKGIAERVEKTRPDLAKKYLKYAIAHQEILSKLLEGKVQEDFSSKRIYILIDEAKNASEE